MQEGRHRQVLPVLLLPRLVQLLLLLLAMVLLALQAQGHLAGMQDQAVVAVVAVRGA
jgi:hypothetical protein